MLNAVTPSLPSRKLTYLTWGKGKSSSNMPYQGDMLVPWRVIHPTSNCRRKTSEPRICNTHTPSPKNLQHHTISSQSQPRMVGTFRSAPSTFPWFYPKITSDFFQANLKFLVPTCVPMFFVSPFIGFWGLWDCHRYGRCHFWWTPNGRKRPPRKGVGFWGKVKEPTCQSTLRAPPQGGTLTLN